MFSDKEFMEMVADAQLDDKEELSEKELIKLFSLWTAEPIIGSRNYS